MSQVDKRLDEMEATIVNEVPAGITITEVSYEGPELVVYTRDPKKFASNGDLIRNLASKLRKRITVRPDPSELSRPDDAQATIESLLPSEAGVTDLEIGRAHV